MARFYRDKTTVPAVGDKVVGTDSTGAELPAGSKVTASTPVAKGTNLKVTCPDKSVVDCDSEHVAKG